MSPAYLLGVWKYRLQLAQEDLCADFLVEVPDFHRNLFRFEPLHGLNKDFWEDSNKQEKGNSESSTYRRASSSVDRGHSSIRLASAWLYVR